MKFGFCGINYKNAKLDIRDHVVFTDSRKTEFFRRLETYGIRQSMVVSTCNRSEVYYFFEQEEQPEIVKKVYQEMFPHMDLSEYLQYDTGQNAMCYFFRVAAGLESQVLGEDQILGQIKEAYEFSKTMGYSRKELNRVVQDAVSTAKKIKTELKISEIPLSISYVGIRKLEQECGIRGKRVLIIGSGQTAALALRYVYAYGAENITICNRTLLHAKELKKEFPDITVETFEQRYLLMKNSDIVISATSSPHLVIRREKCSFSGEIYFLDLASPRDIEVSLGELQNCHLYNLDILEGVVEKNKEQRKNLTIQAETIIESAVEETNAKLLTERVDGTIESLQQRCNEIVEDSFAYLNRKLELQEREQAIVKRTLQAGFKRLLREPILELKKLESEEEQRKYQETLERLFQI
jgi:glutamyl-tRNA reductase